MGSDIRQCAKLNALVLWCILGPLSTNNVGDDGARDGDGRQTRLSSAQDKADGESREDLWQALASSALLRRWNPVTARSLVCWAAMGNRPSLVDGVGDSNADGMSRHCSFRQLS